MEVRLRKVRRRCGVRGCRNIVSYHVSKTREMGNTVMICEECLRAALAGIEAAAPAKAAPVKAAKPRSAGKEKANDAKG